MSSFASPLPSLQPRLLIPHRIHANKAKPSATGTQGSNTVFANIQWRTLCFCGGAGRLFGDFAGVFVVLDLFLARLHFKALCSLRSSRQSPSPAKQPKYHWSTAFSAIITITTSLFCLNYQAISQGFHRQHTAIKVNMGDAAFFITTLTTLTEGLLRRRITSA